MYHSLPSSYKTVINNLNTLAHTNTVVNFDLAKGHISNYYRDQIKVLIVIGEVVVVVAVEAVVIINGEEMEGGNLINDRVTQSILEIRTLRRFSKRNHLTLTYLIASYAK